MISICRTSHRTYVIYLHIWYTHAYIYMQKIFLSCLSVKCSGSFVSISSHVSPYSRRICCPPWMQDLQCRSAGGSINKEPAALCGDSLIGNVVGTIPQDLTQPPKSRFADAKDQIQGCSSRACFLLQLYSFSREA